MACTPKGGPAQSRAAPRTSSVWKSTIVDRGFTPKGWDISAQGNALGVFTPKEWDVSAQGNALGIFTPKGWEISAQGNALGTRGAHLLSRSPNGARSAVYHGEALSPFQGSIHGFDADPGRCPGLRYPTPLG